MAEGAAIAPGDEITIRVTRMAHGGEAIGEAADGRVVFVRGAVPGDTVRARVEKAKPRWIRASVLAVAEPSKIRVHPTCPAAAAGAGCCDYSHIAASAQLALKREILLGQLRSLARASGVLEGFGSDDLEQRVLKPTTGWRTRVRLGVDASGRAGIRRARSNEVVASQLCTQPVEGLLRGIVGASGSDGVEVARFTPGSEVVAVHDADGRRHVVETAHVRRGRRVEAIDTVVEGTGEVTERVAGPTGEYAFAFPATAFWQAHRGAPQAYSEIIAAWGEGQYSRPVAWDLYGGVGAFVPAIAAATAGARVVSVDYSPSATLAPQRALAGFDVEVVPGRVERVVDKLEAPGLVVLDPPRAGAGPEVVGSIAGARPERVIHVGCDPATLARDLRAWGEGGYRVERMLLIDAFPNTHHFETIVQLAPGSQRA